MSADRYPIPVSELRVEEHIERSRFITSVAPASSEAEAHSLIQRVREEFPDATHTCWAFALGPPGNTARIGMSDDGEPHGTAGRPMLQVLLHGGVGDLVAVVTRYYGGVKLGKGGLGRAYAGGVRRALDGLPVRDRILRRPAILEYAYGAIEGVRRLLVETETEVEEEHFGASVRIQVQIPTHAFAQFKVRFGDVTLGAGCFIERA